MSEDFTGVMASMSSDTDAAGSPPDDVSTLAGSSDPSAESSALATTPETDASTTTTLADPLEGQAVPYQRFKEVNERAKTHQQSLERLAWAQAIPETAAPAITQFYQEFQRDPIGTMIRESEALASSDPAHAQALRSAAARWLGAGRGHQGQAQAPPMPQADLQAPDGTLVYSAEQAEKLMDWRDQRSEQALAAKMQPLQKFIAQSQAAQMRGEIKANADTWAHQTLAQWSGRPYFQENKRQIADLMQQHGYGIADAYADLLSTVVLPQLASAERSSVVAAMHTKAAAGTANPSRGPAQGTTTKPRGFGEAYAQAREEAGIR